MASTPMAFTSIFLVSNIHCPSCVSYAQDVLRDIPGVHSTHVSLIDHTVRIKHDHANTQESIITALLKAAFEVQHVTTLDPTGHQTCDYDITPEPTTSSVHRSAWHMSKVQRKHIDNCKACQRDRAQLPLRPSPRALLASPMRMWKSKPQVKRGDIDDQHAAVDEDKPAIVSFDDTSKDTEGIAYTATLSIGGMTCSSCSTTITNGIESLDFVNSVDVNLLANSAKVVYEGPESNIRKIVAAIEDCGYEAIIDHVQQDMRRPPQVASAYRVSLSIDGMTCGSCVGTISEGLKELSFVHSANIDLIGNSGAVIFEGKHNVNAILEKIDDLGYDAVEVKTESLFDTGDAKAQDRTIQIHIDGMFCDHCPTNIKTTLQTSLGHLGRDSFMVTEWPTLKNPIICITYRPSPDLTVRKLIETIKGSHEAFNPTVYHPPSLEERSRRLQRQEQRHYLWRLLFTATVAIPSFIIGVVFMSLVPKSNTTRQWFEEPILGGNAMRIDWALFFITTPIMFFGADIFHRRAFKEVVFMWRPKSNIPLLRRFYRFGSMNLLISAGASVAYFSSLAVLIMDATSIPVAMHGERSSNSYFDTVTFLSFFILIGRFLEAYSKAKTGDAVAMLGKLRPSEAFLVEKESKRNEKDVRAKTTIRSVPVDQLEVGDIVQIPHGASPPTDGIIEQDGTFLFDESSLTGESKPVKKVRDEEVFTGSVNVSDPVKISVTEVDGTSMLDRIVNVVREGQAKRAPIERIADVITGYFVPVVTLLALLTWIIWLGLGESGSLPEVWLDGTRGGWAFWSLKFAIAVFVVACPCGIGLAAPTALFVGGGIAAKQGILVQGGGEAFQDASKLNAIVFDKTGTLTEGKMRVTSFELLQQDNAGGLQEKAVLAMSRAMEDSSTHPIAKAIAEYCAQKSSDTPFEHSDVKEVPGQGLTGMFISKDHQSGEIRYEAVIGNERLFRSTSPKGEDASFSGISMTRVEKPDVEPPTARDFFLTPVLQKHQALGQSTAIFAIRQLADDSKNPFRHRQPFIPVAIFAIADPIRAEAANVLKRLRESNLDVHMCTGDNPTTALAIATQLGIQVSNVRAGVLPQDKAAYIEELQGILQDRADGPTQKRKVVAFVGDGTNDTPALSAADVSIALSSGSDVAMTTASFILLNSDLNTILSLVRLAKRVFLRVKLNFAWAAVYNICLIPVAAGVFFAVGANNDHGGWRLGPVWASAAMALSSVSVVSSSLALKLPELRLRK